ncbi:MAG: hypothetical protein JWM02_2385 [Frankiales bacterium]|nr:hypothetical protein [Frankiales bacterium]
MLPLSTAVAMVLAAVGGLLLVWLLLLAALALARPRKGLLAEALRLLPDLVRLLHRLAVDRTLPRSVRVRVGLLLAYLAMPVDLIPDVIPVLGYADDAIAVAWVLRAVARRVGADVLREHWPGTDDGFAALVRLTGVPTLGREPESQEGGRATGAQ